MFNPNSYIKHNEKLQFDPEWKDNLIEPGCFDIPLFMPQATNDPIGKDTWVANKYVSRDTIFEEEYLYHKSIKQTYLVRKSQAGHAYKITDRDGNTPSEQTIDYLYNFMFNPRVIMCDNAQERSMMYAAAIQAEGNVLIGGLGLAIYPQFILFLERPVSSFTIIENDPAIIEIVGKKWLKIFPENMIKVEIIEDTYEHYVQNSSDLYDTIYLDIWNDLHPKFLPYINYLVNISKPRLNENGQIFCWGYYFMMQNFVEFITAIEEKGFDKLKPDFSDDFLLKKYIEWRKEQNNPSLEMLKNKAKELSISLVTEEKIPLTIDRNRFEGRF